MRDKASLKSLYSVGLNLAHSSSSNAAQLCSNTATSSWLLLQGGRRLGWLSAAEPSPRSRRINWHNWAIRWDPHQRRMRTPVRSPWSRIAAFLHFVKSVIADHLYRNLATQLVTAEAFLQGYDCLCQLLRASSIMWSLSVVPSFIRLTWSYKASISVSKVSMCSLLETILITKLWYLC